MSVMKDHGDRGYNDRDNEGDLGGWREFKHCLVTLRAALVLARLGRLGRFSANANEMQKMGSGGRGGTPKDSAPSKNRSSTEKVHSRYGTKFVWDSSYSIITRALITLHFGWRAFNCAAVSCCNCCNFGMIGIIRS